MVDRATVNLLARAYRWRKMLDTGEHATLEELARAKGFTPSYVSRVPRLTLLAPEFVEAILDGRQPEVMQLDDLLGGVSSGVGGAALSLRLTARSERTATEHKAPGRANLGCNSGRGGGRDG